MKAEVTAENRPAYDTNQRVRLNDVHNVRISESHLNRPYISPEIHHRNPSPPCRTVCRIRREDPREILLSFYMRVLTVRWQGTG